VNRRVIG